MTIEELIKMLEKEEDKSQKVQLKFWDGQIFNHFSLLKHCYSNDNGFYILTND